MTDRILVTGINEWLVDQALGEPDIIGMFEGLCSRLHGIGIPLGRARLAWQLPDTWIIAGTSSSTIFS